MSVGVRRARVADLAAAADLVAAAGLPLAGFPDDARVILVAEQASGLVGVAALELHEDAALLRSVAVPAEWRGQGIGGALVTAALEAAWTEGASSVALLTETAASYFPAFGFRSVPRSALPSALAASREMQGACPESAVAMVLERSSRPPSAT
jgi:amino-acid N-acetyltransferase